MRLAARRNASRWHPVVFATQGSECEMLVNGRPHEVACNFWRHLQKNIVVASIFLQTPKGNVHDFRTNPVGRRLAAAEKTIPFARTIPWAVRQFLPCVPPTSVGATLCGRPKTIPIAHTSPWSPRHRRWHITPPQVEYHVGIADISRRFAAYHSPKANITSPQVTLYSSSPLIFSLPSSA